MKVQGCDCSIVIKTSHHEKSIPYSDETLREAVSVLEEFAAIEGGSQCKAIRKNSGVVGCVVTPLTIGTAPLLLYLAMGSAGTPVYASIVGDIYRYQLDLLAMEDTAHFDLIQERGGERRLFEACRVKGFELRVMRGETIKLKLDITSERVPISLGEIGTLSFAPQNSRNKPEERFNGDNVTYKVNNTEYSNIYGCTLLSKKEGGTRTELWIKRALEQGQDFPIAIEEMTITAQLLRDCYGHKRFGTYRITIKRLVLVSDETQINTADSVIGPLRYYACGTVEAHVFSIGERLENEQ